MMDRVKRWMSALDAAAAGMNGWLTLVAIGLAIVTGLAAGAPRPSLVPAAEMTAMIQPAPPPAIQAPLIGQD